LIVEGLASCSAASFHEGSLCVRAHMTLASIALSASRDVEGCLARLQKAQATVTDKTGLLGTGSPKASIYSELKRQLLMAQAHDLAGAVDAALEAYSAVLATARDSGDADALCTASVGVAELLCSKDRPADAREVLTRATSEMSGLTASQLASLHCSLAWATYLLTDLDAAKSLLQEHHLALTSTVERARALKRLAIVYWHADGGVDRTDKTKCFGSLLQAAKLAPRDGEAFAWLGKWYHEIAIDIVRAEKCFLKALSLVPLNEMAGVSLSTIYEQQGKTELCLSLWQDLTASPESAPTWALLRLAQHLVDRDSEDAVAKLHLVLRNEPLHAPHWVAMGHVYRHFGKPVAAQRSYVRAIELGERGWCVLTELARIEGSLHLYDDALARIQQATTVGAVDDDASRDVIATVHAELLFEQAKYFNGEGLYGRAVANVKKAAALLTADSGSKAAATLKLLGDIHCFAFYLSPLDFVDDGDSGWLAFLSCGRAAYEQVLATLSAASDSPEAAAQAHYDIGVSCWYQARALDSLHGRRFNAFALLQHHDADSMDERVHQYLCDARTHLRRALASTPSFALAWNALGVVLAHPMAKQRAWTRAIQASNLDAAWANLGMLYVHHGSAELARNAFLHLQAVNTNNPAMWLGYGMLYLRQREDRKAVEAFQCALEMGNHLDALQGVVLATLVSQEKEAEGKEAMPVLQFAIKKYLERETFDPLAWSLLSSVQLQVGLLAQAAGSSAKSQELLGDDTHDALAKHHTITTAAFRISEGRDTDDAFASLHEAFAWSAAGRLVLAAQRCYATSDFAGALHAARTALSTAAAGDQQGAVAAFVLGLCALVPSKKDAHPLAETALTVVRERMVSGAATIHEVDAAEAFYRATESLDSFLSLLDAYPYDGRADTVADFIAVHRGLALVDSVDPTAFASPSIGSSSGVAEALYLSVLKTLFATGHGSSPMKLVRAEPWNPSAYAYAALHVYASAVARGSTDLASALRLLETGLRLATDGQPSVLLHWTSALVHQRLTTDESQVQLHVGKALDCLRATELPAVDRLLWEARIHAVVDPVAAVAKYAEALKTATSANVVLAILYELGGVCEATGLLDTAHHVWKTVMTWKHSSNADDALNVPGFLGNLHLAIVHATKQNAKSAKKFSKTAVTLATAGGDDSLMATTARFVESVVAKM
jgi:superkiller protein 3